MRIAEPRPSVLNWMGMPPSLTWDELAAWKAEGRPYTLVDVRDLEEVAAGAVPEARHLPLDGLARYAPLVLPDRGRTVVCYCASGRRSLAAARWLLEQGYRDVWSVRDGFGALAR